jgi:hypothetical protein
MLSENNPEARELAEAGARYDVARSMDRGGDAAFMAASLVQAAALLSIARSLAEIAEKSSGNTWPEDGKPDPVLTRTVPKPGKRRPTAEEAQAAPAIVEAMPAVEAAIDGFAGFAEPETPTKKSKKGKKGKKSKKAAPVKRQLTTKERLADALAAAEAEPGFSRTPPPPLVPRPGERDPMIEVDTPGLGRD